METTTSEYEKISDDGKSCFTICCCTCCTACCMLAFVILILCITWISTFIDISVIDYMELIAAAIMYIGYASLSISFIIVAKRIYPMLQQFGLNDSINTSKITGTEN